MNSIKLWAILTALVLCPFASAESTESNVIDRSEFFWQKKVESQVRHHLEDCSEVLEGKLLQFPFTSGKADDVDHPTERFFTPIDARRTIRIDVSDDSLPVETLILALEHLHLQESAELRTALRNAAVDRFYKRINRLLFYNEKFDSGEAELYEKLALEASKDLFANNPGKKKALEHLTMPFIKDSDLERFPVSLRYRFMSAILGGINIAEAMQVSHRKFQFFIADWYEYHGREKQRLSQDDTLQTSRLEDSILQRISHAAKVWREIRTIIE
jgi:hypothetical protein